MAEMDISKYTVDDILSIFNIIDPTTFNVTDVANTLIAKMKIEGRSDLVTFFGAARDKVLNYLQALNSAPIENEAKPDEMIDNVWKTSGFNENNELNPIYYFQNGSHLTPPKQTVSSQTVPVISRHIINIDSQFRSTILPYQNNPLSNTFNTSFSFNLTSQILKAISITLYSYHIPTTWYSFSAQSGNTFFMYNGVMINIPDGNYTPTTLVNTINAIAATTVATQSLVVAYNTASNRISFINTDPLIDTVSVIFYTQSNVTNFSNCGSFILTNFQTLSLNTTLGWLLGFRTPPDPVTGDIVLFLPPQIETVADVAPDTYGPKYFTLSIEDYSNQRLSSGLYNITNTKIFNTLSVQDYYNTIGVACKLREGSLTQAQIFAINAITNPFNNLVNGANSNNTLKGPTSSTTFATIPLAGINAIRPDPYIKFGADLAIYKRNYIRPTILERFTIYLNDDKGNLVNLYDNDWSFSLVVEERLN